MATKSMLKSVNVNTRKQIEKMVTALENAEANRGKEVVMSRTVVNVQGQDVVKVLSSYKFD